MSHADPPGPRRTNVFPMLRRMGEAVEQLERKNDALTPKVK
jgi:hypothetical protein